MIAKGEHVLIRKPAKKTHEGPIIMPDSYDQEYAYGKVVSITEESGKRTGVKEGEFVVFDNQGERALVLNERMDDRLVAVHYSQIFCTIALEQLEARKLPIPA